MKDNNKKKASLWKSLQLGLAVLAGLLVYAYGFQITQVDLEDLRSERRQESLVRVMRALARPEIFEYEQEVEVINAPIYVPCPADGAELSSSPEITPIPAKGIILSLRTGARTCAQRFPLTASGSARATSEVLAPAPVAKTMYCLPWCRNVIGTAVVREGIASAPTCFPVFLSTA